METRLKRKLAAGAAGSSQESSGNGHSAAREPEKDQTIEVAHVSKAGAVMSDNSDSDSASGNSDQSRIVSEDQGSDSESDLEQELQKLKAEQAKMKAKLKSQSKKKEKKDLIKKLTAENQALKVKLKVSTTSRQKVRPQVTPGESSTDPGAVNLGDLRRMDDLVLQAEEHMQAYGDLQSSSSSDSTGKKRRKPLRSGQTVKVAHGVKKQLRWPHTLLRYSYAQSNLTFVQLDFPLLVAGEISCILSPKLGENEKVGRLRLLQATAYHSKAFEWQACLNFFSTCLLEVERGERSWTDNRGWLVEEANTLYQHPIRERAKSLVQAAGGASNPPRRRWFCQAFQKGECNHRGSHDASVKGVRRTVEHFCASCFQKSKVVEMHSESSRDCPLQAQVENEGLSP